MAEAVAMLGLMANIFQFVQLGCEILSSSKRIYELGHSVQVRDIKRLLEDISARSERILKADIDSYSDDELAIRGYASECRSIAADLDQLLSKLSIQDDAKSRTLESLRVAYQNVAYQNVAYQNVAKKNDVQMLVERLRNMDDRLRDRLRSVFDRKNADQNRHHYSSISRMIDGLEISAIQQGTAVTKGLRDLRRVVEFDLQSQTASMAEDMAHLKEDSSRLVAGQIDLRAVHSETMALCSHLVQLGEESGKLIAYKDILDSLLFSDIKQRYSDIDRAHKDTFNWVFDASTTSLPAWLESGSGVFWITGLAGSGKSTLMKYVYDQAKTHMLLRSWAGKSRLITAHFYFWNLGTKMQKSQQGLLQSLLFQIIKADVDLALDLCRGRHIAEPWTIDELRDVFRRTPDMTAAATKYCFFVDGLDEYDGYEEDIIDTIQTLASSPSDKIRH